MTFDYRGFVLIVDDTPTNLAVISEALNDAGFETAVATSGERALKQMERRSPDLILLDIMMPGIDGFETCRYLKADPRYGDIPIIFMTALADVNSKVQGFDLGAVDYITKPFQEREVLARVGTHLKLKQTRQELQASEARLDSILNSLDEIVWSATLEPFRLLHVNSVVEKILGYAPAPLIQDVSLFWNRIEPTDQEMIRSLFSNPMDQQRHSFEYRIQTRQGETRWLMSKTQIRWCAQAKQYIMDGITHDISDRKQAESQLQYTACHDDLTGLMNRSFFIKAVDEMLAEHQRLAELQRDRFAVLFIDLDRFKTVNDSLGHQQGDQLLVKVANELKQSVRPADLVARLGGDEFTILLRNLCDEAEANMIIHRLQAKLDTSFELEMGVKVAMSASIGVVMGTPKYHSAHELLRDADIAMYQAKKLGKACHQLFSEEMYEAALKKINLERDLRTALEQLTQSEQSLPSEHPLLSEPSSQLLLHYQPIYQLVTQKLVGFEALVRWNHPTQGLIAPGEFIPLAEETGLIIPLGWQIMRWALTQLSDWKKTYPFLLDVTMSVNLSSRQLQEPGFLQHLDEILLETETHPSAVKLEITESLLMQGGEAGFAILNALRARGFSLSLDDFGTGYSSLSYLHRFPINTLKIDRSFVQKLEPGVSSVEIVRSITQLARSLRMDVVAEGVETNAQSEQLKELSCEMVQGYLFSKPLNVTEVAAYLNQCCEEEPRQGARRTEENPRLRARPTVSEERGDQNLTDLDRHQPLPSVGLIQGQDFH